MTRKHFAAIANTLNDNLAPLYLVEDMADTLAMFNDQFDRERFIKAATVRLLDQSNHDARKVAQAHGL